MDIQEKTGTTFVIVTHDQEEAMTVASRVAVMDTGKIIQADTPQVIYEAPASRYVADFIGDVNLIDGVAEVRGGAAAAAPAEPEAAKQAEPEAPAAASERRVPQPNARGKWLHDKLFKYILGPREDAPKQLPPPTAEESKAAAAAVPLPEAVAPGGITIHWAEGQPPLIVSNGDPALAGQRVTLALRPEKLGISKDRPEAANALKGKVIDIAYLGNLSTYHVELANGTMVKAQLANTRRVAQRDITWDDEVWISFRETAGVVLSE
jgi:ABC-type Fe3+/spermidine/putrescine transport system ATPase subunit